MSNKKAYKKQWFTCGSCPEEFTGTENDAKNAGWITRLVDKDVEWFCGADCRNYAMTVEIELREQGLT